MNIVKTAINLIIVPLFSLIFIMAGLLSALISAIIEYHVVSQLLYSSYSELADFSTLGFLIIFCFEFVKIFMHLILKRQKLSCSSHLNGVRALIITLVCFSFTCSVIYTVNVLYLPQYNSEEISAQIADIEKELENEIQKITLKHNDIYKDAIQPYESAKKDILESIANPPTGLSPNRLKAYLEKLNESYDKACEEYNAASERLSLTRDNNIEEEVNALKLQAEADKQAISDTASEEVACKYDNPVIAHFLNVLAYILFKSSHYSRRVYLLICILIGILIAALLEAIISIVMQFTSIPKDFMTDSIPGVGQKVYVCCGKIVITLFKSFCAIMLSIIILGFASGDMSSEKIMAGLLACFVSISLIHAFVPIPKLDIFDTKAKLFYVIRDCLLQGVVSLMGYIILGFVFGENAVNLDVNTVAIGIGSTISSCIIQVPKLFLGATNASNP